MKNFEVCLTTCVLLSISVAFSSCSDYTTGSKSFAQADFSKFKSYAWLPNVDSVQVNDINHEHLFRIISDNVDEELSARGYTTDNIQPDFLVRVSLYVNFSNTLVSSQFYSYPRMLTVYNFFCSPEDYAEYPEQYYYHPGPKLPESLVTFRNGTLLVDIINASTGEPLWLGYAESSKQFAGEAPDTNLIRTRAQEIIKTIFKNFPVTKTKKVISNNYSL